MAAHSSVLAWRIPWTEAPGGPPSTGSQESDTTEPLAPAPVLREELVLISYLAQSLQSILGT